MADRTKAIPGDALMRMVACMLLACILGIALSGCGSSSTDKSSSAQAAQASSTAAVAEASDQTSGAAFSRPPLELSSYDANGTVGQSGASIDVSHLGEGYVSVSATGETRLKFEVAKDGVSMYFDLPQDGSPIVAPLSMGDGQYKFAVWENTSGQKYANLASTDQLVMMEDEFQPFLRPNVYSQYDASSDVVKAANALTADAENVGDAVSKVYNWVVENIDYDEAKAAQLAGGTGYVPNPDETYNTRKGICFDYSSLVAAMLRSQGIPCKIITGNVSPDDIYHAWNEIYIDGTWVTGYIDVKAKTWTRIDTTFASSGGSAYVGDGSRYTEKYVY